MSLTRYLCANSNAAGMEAAESLRYLIDAAAEEAEPPPRPEQEDSSRIPRGISRAAFNMRT
jgi:hypothetical protein